MLKSDLTIREIQKLELDILSYFHEVCEEYNLTYYLAYGSLIGAIRHRGFIPWDDDIDVMMPRHDYYKFVEIIRKTPHDYYKLVSTETDSNFTAPLPKIIDTRTRLIQHYDYSEKVALGVYIDIFMLDGAKNSYEDALQWYDESFKYYRDWRIADLAIFPPGKSKIYGLLRYIKNIRYKFHNISYYLNRLKEHNSRYQFEKCDYVSTLEVGTLPGLKCVWPKSYFEPKSMTQFENREFYIPQNFNAILKSEYGNYMKLPPESQQKPHHVYTLEIDEDLKLLIEAERQNKI